MNTDGLVRVQIREDGADLDWVIRMGLSGGWESATVHYDSTARVSGVTFYDSTGVEGYFPVGTTIKGNFTPELDPRGK